MDFGSSSNPGHCGEHVPDPLALFSLLIKWRTSLINPGVLWSAEFPTTPARKSLHLNPRTCTYVMLHSNKGFVDVD